MTILASMGVESRVMIGGTYYAGTSKRLGGRQMDLFNADDLVAIGSITDDTFVRAYRISVRELRRRLEALGYTLQRVHQDITGTLRRALSELGNQASSQSKAFLGYGSTITMEQLIALLREWKGDGPKFDSHDPGDVPAVLIEYLQGSVRAELVPSEDSLVDDGYHFERLLCEVHDDQDLFEIDFTKLVRSGHYRPDDRPLGNQYDQLLSGVHPYSLRIGQRLIQEESDVLEYKSLSASNPCKAIAQAIDKYAIGFLNYKGGRILYGVTDDGIVDGVKLTRTDRDGLQRKLNEACQRITPRFSLSTMQVEFRPIIGSGGELPDLFVIEVSIPPGRATEMYFRDSDTWVRVGTETRAIRGHELFVHICARYSSADDLLKTVNQRVYIATEEIARLKQDGERYEGELASKRAEMDDLRSTLSGAWRLLKETDMICPNCEAALKERSLFSEVYVAGNGSDFDADFELIEYECGYSVRTDRRSPLTPCTANKKP